MRIMHLPAIPIAAQSREECIELYVERLSAKEAFRSDASVLLTAYLAWPNDEERRNSFVVTSLAQLSRPSAEVTASSANISTKSMFLETFGGLAQW